MEVLTEHGVDAFTEWTLVCGDHFTHEDYKMTARKNFLLPTAVPSVFTVTPCKNLPRKRGRKPKALLLQQQQQAAQARRVTVLRTVVEDEDGQLRRTGRQRKQKLFTDMVLYMPTTATEEGQNADDDVSDGNADEPSGLGPPLEESSQDAAGTEPNDEQAAKNVNVIVFTNQPRPAAIGDGEAGSSEQPNRPPKRRCCQIQAQRLLFYRSVITKLRKRVLSLEACLADRDREVALFEAQKDALE